MVFFKIQNVTTWSVFPNPVTIWYVTSMALLPSVRITSEICLFTAILTDKDNPSSDALLSENLSNSQETFVEGRRVHF